MKLNITIKKPRRKVTEVFCHHTGDTNPDHDIGWITELHTKTNGWADCGYHYFIDQKGCIFTGRNIELTPAAQSGHNTGTIAICVAGVGDSFTPGQMGSLKKLCLKLNKLYDGELVFRGHKETFNTRCPEYDYKKVLGLDENGRMA